MSADPPGVGTGGGLPDFEAAREHVLRELVRFARQLRAEGVDVPATAALPAAAALATVGLRDRRRVRAALAATMVTDPRDRAVLEERFPAFWYRLRTGLEATAAADDVGERAAGDGDGAGDEGPSRPSASATPAELAPADGATVAAGEERGLDDGVVESRRVADRPASPGTDDADAGPDAGRPGTYSPAGDRSPVGGEEIAGADDDVDLASLARFERALAACSGRRWTRAGDEAVDARRALRESLGTGGLAVSLPTRERDRTALRATVLVDVSRSVLDAVDRGFLLSVVDGLVDDGRTVRAFFFDTDLREVTDAFARSAGDPAAALERAEVAWGGGTRIGASLATLRERWPGSVGRRTVTLVVSDGLDVGDVEDLEEGMAWLASRSRAVVWLNPLAASSAYEPTCRGMAAALPYVDALFAFAGPADLAEVARQLERRGPRGPVGYRHDFRDREGAAATEGSGGGTA